MVLCFKAWPFAEERNFVEALVITGRPILITFPLAVIFVMFTARAGFLNPMEVFREIPAAMIAGFYLAVFAFVFLAYYIGGRKVHTCNLVGSLSDDTMA